jgi:hypothetical protein
MAGSVARLHPENAVVRIFRYMQFAHPLNRYVVKVRVPWLWTLVFGPLYLAFHEAWGQALISFVVACATVGLSWVVYPFFARRIVRNAYLRKGWQETMSD